MRPWLCSIAFAAVLCIGTVTAAAQEADTVANLTLEQSELTVKVDRPMILSTGGISGTVNVSMIHSVPSFLGNSDPLRFVRLLPGIQVNTEIDGGLYMQGSEYSHTILSIAGVPVYGGSHMLGLFSVFNSPHYKELDYSTSAGQIPRLGGRIDMTLHDDVPERVTGELSVGLLSAQGTLRLPTGSNSALTVSARRTWINLLYGRYIKFADQPIRYGFTDANLTWFWKPGKRDRVWVDLFGGNDKGKYTYETAGLSVEGDWYNALGAVHWKHYFPSCTFPQTAYATINGLQGHVDLVYAWGDLPSHLHTYGYNASAQWDYLIVTGSLAWHRDQPQNPPSEGSYHTSLQSTEPLQDALESTVSATYSRILGYYLKIKAGTGLNLYLSPEKRLYWGLTPQADIIVDMMEGGSLDLGYAIRRQNLFQTGFTNVGLPVEFWFLAGDLSAPQWSHNFSIKYDLSFARDMYSLSAELYYKRLYNQVEYKGTIMEILNTSYSLKNSLLCGDGYAWGANLMLKKQAGKLTGWIGYAYGRSLRRFDDPMYPGIYPSDHERLHELNVVATWDLNRFDIGGTFVAASGTPYTRVEAFYMLGGRLLTAYGERNASRLPAYIRMDLSANWYFLKKERHQAGLNLSIYNVLCRNNAVGYGIMEGSDGNSFVFSPTSFGIKFMPSLALFYKF
jgi:hypothetical protein